MSAEKSTSVRFRILAAGLRLLQRASAAAAAAAAERLFRTPPRHAVPARERELLAGGRAFDVRVGGWRLRAWRFGRGPAVLLVHGWGGRGGQLATLAAPLVESGFSVVAFDGPGHGQSSGRRAALPLFVEALLGLQRQVGPFRALVGHSLGAAAGALAVQRGLAVQAAVFLAPPRSPLAFFERFAQALGLSADTRRRAQLRMERRLGVSFESLDAAQAVPAGPTPLLVIHDADDRDVPLQHGRAIAAVWPGAELVVTRGLGHRRLLRSPDVLAGVAAFLRRHVSTRCANPGCEAPLGADWRGGDPSLCGACGLSLELFAPASRRLPNAA